MLDFIKLVFFQDFFHILTLVDEYIILPMLDLKSYEDVEFSHYTHLKLLTYQMSKLLTEIIVSSTKYDIIYINLNNEKVFPLCFNGKGFCQGVRTKLLGLVLSHNELYEA